MAHRRVTGLISAVACGWPQIIPKPRTPHGAKAQGIYYERQLARMMPWARHGQWFDYRDYEGKGYCQTDLLIEREEFVVVLECKHTWTVEGHTQLEQLYRPVVERALRRPMFGVVVCKYLTPETPRPIISGDLGSAFELARTGSQSVWHWLAKSVPLGLTPWPREGHPSVRVAMAH